MRARLAFVAAAALLAQASFGQLDPFVPADDMHGDLSGLAVDVRSGWPNTLVAGYFPVFVRLVNGTGAPEVVSIEIEREGWGDDSDRYRIDRTVHLAAGEAREVELLAPPRCEPDGSSTFPSSVLVRALSGETFYASFDLDSSQMRPMIATRDAGAGAMPEAAQLAEVLNDRDFAVQLSFVPSDRLPQRIHAYTSLAAVLVDVRALPSEGCLEPALAWVRLGGAIAFIGPDAVDSARSLASVRPWMEERFEHFRRERVGSWRMGHGRVIAVESDDLERAEVGDLVRSAFAGGGVRPPGAALRAHPSIPGLGELPYRAFAVLMMLFAVLVGPVNFIALRRANKSGLLLVTIPVLAAAVSIVFLLYGVLHQGLDVKRAEFSLTVLDQRAHSASTLSARQVFAGIVPGGGLHPEYGTVVLPRSLEAERASLYTLRLDDDGLSMAGDYLPARDAVDQVVLTDRTARLRVVLERDGDALFVENALTTRVLEFSYRAPDDTWLASEGVLEPGQRAALVAKASDPSVELVERAWNRDLWTNSIPLGTYVAQVETNPFLDDCGLDSVEYEGWHVVVGIPEEAP